MPPLVRGRASSVWQAYCINSINRGARTVHSGRLTFRTLRKNESFTIVFIVDLLSEQPERRGSSLMFPHSTACLQHTESAARGCGAGLHSLGVRFHARSQICICMHLTFTRLSHPLKPHVHGVTLVTDPAPVAHTLLPLWDTSAHRSPAQIRRRPEPNAPHGLSASAFWSGRSSSARV